MLRTYNSQYPIDKKQEIVQRIGVKSDQMETFQNIHSNTQSQHEQNQFNVEGFESFLQEYEINLNKQKYELHGSVRKMCTETRNSR